MKYIYKHETGLTRVKSKTKRYVAVVFSGIALAGSLALPAMAAPTSGPVAGPGCFGQWRAGTADGSVFSERKGNNSTINAQNRATCDALTPQN